MRKQRLDIKPNSDHRTALLQAHHAGAVMHVSADLANWEPSADSRAESV